jgi:hypothetical protein
MKRLDDKGVEIEIVNVSDYPNKFYVSNDNININGMDSTRGL